MTQKIKSLITILAISIILVMVPATPNIAFAGSSQDTSFQQSATNFNLDLAKFSLTLSTVAYGNTSEIIEGFLTEQGFTNDTTYDAGSYEKASHMGTNLVAYSFAHKQLKCENKDYTLVAVVIRGTMEDSEWISNFNINDSGNSPAIHEGFSKAEKSLLSNLNNYIKSLNLDKSNTKFLITGHSRGAAVANILAADLSKHGKLAYASNIYGYTFATPNVAKISSNKYFNIFNAVNPVDVVTEMPLSKWGYGKYGVNYTLPDESHINAKDLAATKHVLSQFTSMAPTVKDFYKSNLALIFLKGDIIPTETSKAHNPQVYMDGLNSANQQKLLDEVFDLQLKLIPDDVYA